ncbi:MAG: transposase [Chitinophagaceae bacterium]|nr:transposase [Chitinophagaceae bacterium]
MKKLLKTLQCNPGQTRQAYPLNGIVADFKAASRNLSDESVVGQWAENAYYQYFGGEKLFSVKPPCVPTELVEFRKRIGEAGSELIFKESIRINGKDADDDNLSGDTTVQEKNITYPTDDKLYKKDNCKMSGHRPKRKGWN